MKLDIVDDIFVVKTQGTFQTLFCVWYTPIKTQSLIEFWKLIFWKLVVLFF